MSKRIRFTRHATERIEQRGPNIAGVIRAIEGPLVVMALIDGNAVHRNRRRMT
jgi:hypothetical protein